MKYKDNPKLYNGPLLVVFAILWWILGRLLFSTPPGTYRTDYSGIYLIILIWFLVLLGVGLLGIIYTIQGIQINLKKKRIE